MGRWISDNTTRTRNWVAALVVLGWMLGAVAVWTLYRTRLPAGTDLRWVIVGIVIGSTVGIGVSLTFLSAIFRRLFGWKWHEMDFAKYDYSAASAEVSQGAGLPVPPRRRIAQPSEPRFPIER